MSALVDKAIIALLAFAVALLVWKLYRKEAPKRDDPLNLAGFEERSNRFDREISTEERLSRK